MQQIQLRHDLPVIPVVVYLRGGEPDVTTKTVRETVLGLEMNVFRYLTFGLSPSDAETYLRSEQPLAWALAALMRRGKLRPAHHKLACLKRIAESATDGARRFLLINCVETYIELEPEDQEELETMIAETQNRDVLAERLTWAEKIELRSLKTRLLRLLEHKFGPLASATRSQIEAVHSLDQVDALFDRVLTAESLEEMGLA